MKMLDSGTVNSQYFVGSPVLFLLREISSVISAGREEDSWSEVRDDFCHVLNLVIIYAFCLFAGCSPGIWERRKQ